MKPEAFTIIREAYKTSLGPLVTIEEVYGGSVVVTVTLRVKNSSFSVDLVSEISKYYRPGIAQLDRVELQKTVNFHIADALRNLSEKVEYEAKLLPKDFDEELFQNPLDKSKVEG